MRACRAVRIDVSDAATLKSAGMRARANKSTLRAQRVVCILVYAKLMHVDKSHCRADAPAMEALWDVGRGGCGGRKNDKTGSNRSGRPPRSLFFEIAPCRRTDGGRGGGLKSGSIARYRSAFHLSLAKLWSQKQWRTD